MRALKKLTACALATAIAASISVSAFAAELNSSNKIVLSESESYTPAGQTTVLVVPSKVWVNNALTGLSDSDILYIDQYETAADTTTAITSGLGVKLNKDGTLDDGDYYLLLGGNTGDNGSFAIKAFSFTVSGETAIIYGDADNNATVNVDDVVAMIKVLGGGTVNGFNNIAADVDANGELNVDDVVLLIKYLGGASVTLGPTKA